MKKNYQLNPKVLYNKDHLFVW